MESIESLKQAAETAWLKRLLHRLRPCPLASREMTHFRRKHKQRFTQDHNIRLASVRRFAEETQKLKVMNDKPWRRSTKQTID